MLINSTLSVSQMLPLLFRTNAAYIQITLNELYASLKKGMGMHDKVFEISQRKLKVGKK